MLADVIPIARQHAAEIMRPREIGRRVEDDVAGMPGAQLLWLRRKPEEGIDLALNKQFEGVASALGCGHPADVFGRIEPDLRRHQGQHADRRYPEPDGL